MVYFCLNYNKLLSFLFFYHYLLLILSGVYENYKYIYIYNMVDVIIIGAGPIGLACSIEAKKKVWKV